MKSNLKISAGILLVFVSSSVCSLAQPGGPINPATGLPISQPQQFDPATGMPIAGLPIATEAPEWKDPNWKDPEITVTNVFYDNIPLSEIARLLTEQFKQQFDILLPGNSSPVSYVKGQAFPTGLQIDWRSETVALRLKNVTASEIFAAMNLFFENNRTPLRWELKMNGHRQLAFLRVLADPTPQENAPPVVPAPEMQRRVYFVGNLIGDEKNGGMTMEQIINTVTDVWHMAAGGDVSRSGGSVEVSGGRIQFHKEAQLLVVTGTPSQIDFMEQTLKALAQKVDREKPERERKSAPPEKPKLF